MKSLSVGYDRREKGNCHHRINERREKKEGGISEEKRKTKGNL